MAAKKREQLNDEQLCELADRVVAYSIERFFSYTRHLFYIYLSEIENDCVEVRRAFVEACSIHVRALVEFLSLHDPRPADIVADDFLYDHPIGWRSIKSEVVTQQLLDVRKRFGPAVGHLSQKRIWGGVPEGGEWPFLGILHEMVVVLDRFVKEVDSVSERRLGPRFRTAVQEMSLWARKFPLVEM